MKILIIAPTFVPGIDGPQLLEENTFADVDKETAGALCIQSDKALYVEKKDDPSKTKQFTAPESLVKAVEGALAAAAKAKKAAE